jgi:hypothetical protein
MLPRSMFPRSMPPRLTRLLGTRRQPAPTPVRYRALGKASRRRRAVLARDRRCRVPGCTHAMYLDVMSFRISGLPLPELQRFFLLDEAELAVRQIVRRVADSRPGYPCRVSLRDGERLLLLNYEHLAVPNA